MHAQDTEGYKLNNFRDRQDAINIKINTVVCVQAHMCNVNTMPQCNMKSRSKKIPCQILKMTRTILITIAQNRTKQLKLTLKFTMQLILMMMLTIKRSIILDMQIKQCLRIEVTKLINRKFLNESNCIVTRLGCARKLSDYAHNFLEASLYKSSDSEQSEK